MKAKDFLTENSDWFDKSPGREKLYFESEVIRMVNEYTNEALRKHDVIGRFTSLEECKKEAISFTENKLKVVSGLLSEDYKIGYKEGVEHYLASKNDL